MASSFKSKNHITGGYTRLSFVDQCRHSIIQEIEPYLLIACACKDNTMSIWHALLYEDFLSGLLLNGFFSLAFFTPTYRE